MSLFSEKNLSKGNKVTCLPHDNATSPYTGNIDLITEHYIRINWKSDPARYDILSHNSPLWHRIKT